ncbi:hypothetical protein M422DRAFT_149016 [Sphaerobolus stellatus SS14]|nr:hypothetical protein M422DRAFT_149016 [Sphaerobolus stellatus SS14]
MFRQTLARTFIPASGGPTRFASLSLRPRRFATLADEVRSDDTFHIPIVDFGKFRYAKDDVEKQEAARQVVGAFKEVGFVYLKNHGIENATVKNAFKKSDEFFKLPYEVKVSLSVVIDPRANRGYVAKGRERVTQSADAAEIAAMRAKAPDFKESMEIGRDWDPLYKNFWPEESELPGFKTTVKDFFQTCHDLHVSVMSSVAMGLGIDEKFFDSLINEQYHNMRLLSYPPVKASVLQQEGQARAGAHSGRTYYFNNTITHLYRILDYGTLTFVFQDSVGGLEVQNPHTKQFHPATPIEDTIVVNVGDLLARWSNDTFRSTLHRVVAPRRQFENDEFTPARQSIAFFCNPNGGATISCLPHITASQAKYPAVTTEEYIVGR